MRRYDSLTVNIFLKFLIKLTFCAQFCVKIIAEAALKSKLKTKCSVGKKKCFKNAYKQRA